MKCFEVAKQIFDLVDSVVEPCVGIEMVNHKLEPDENGYIVKINIDGEIYSIVPDSIRNADYPDSAFLDACLEQARHVIRYCRAIK